MKYYIERAISILVAILFLKTLYFKFTGVPESVYIFSKLELESFGRFGAGIAELITSLLLLFRKTSLYGAVLGIGIISFAIILHIFYSGTEVLNDSGLLVALTFLIFTCCAVSIFLQKEKMKFMFLKIRR